MLFNAHPMPISAQTSPDRRTRPSAKKPGPQRSDRMNRSKRGLPKIKTSAQQGSLHRHAHCSRKLHHSGEEYAIWCIETKVSRIGDTRKSAAGQDSECRGWTCPDILGSDDKPPLRLMPWSTVPARHLTARICLRERPAIYASSPTSHHRIADALASDYDVGTGRQILRSGPSYERLLYRGPN